MNNDIQLISKTSKTAEPDVVLIKADSGKTGQTVTIKAQANSTYELRNPKGKAPDQILMIRKGKDLHLLLNPEGDESDLNQKADLVIENYFGESGVKPIGVAENGKYYNFLPQEGTADLLAWNLADNDFTYQSLGEIKQASYWPLLLLGGLGFIGGGGGNPPAKPDGTPIATLNPEASLDDDVLSQGNAGGANDNEPNQTNYQF